MFERRIFKRLLEWKDSPYRKPLVLRGARQVGKTTVIKQLSAHYDQSIYLNLETKADQAIFTNRASIREIVDALFFIKERRQDNGKTLIFMDEIQGSPEAIDSLRYFYEEYPHYHVVAAGSLLEAVFEPKIKFPVGRVDYMVLHPFSYEEFLWAMGEEQATEQYNKVPIASFAHERLLQLFHLYVLVGGMPEAVMRYMETRDLVAVRPVYESLLQGYIDDVEKYARNSSQAQVIRYAITSCFREAGARIKFQGFGASTYNSREMGEALRTLQKARLLELLYPTTQITLPYAPDMKKSPRLQVLDTGLLNFFAGVQKDVFTSRDLNDVYQGRIIEHITGQELTSNNDEMFRNLLFWVRDKQGTTSELDYLFIKDGVAFAVEVKSGKSGKLRSLHQYAEMARPELAVRLYAGHFQIDHLKTLSGHSFRLMNLPYYLSGKLKEYLEL